jgi:serine/threonine-protein kinase
VAESIPEALDDLVHRATRRDPGARPRDAATLLAQIQTAREEVGALTGPTRAMAHPTVVVAPVAATYRPGWSRLPAQPDRSGRPARRPAGRVAAGTGARVYGAGGPPGLGERLRAMPPAAAGWMRITADRLRYTARGRRTLVAGAVVAGLLLILGGWWVGVGRYTDAPALLQLTKDNAISEAERQGFTIAFGAPMYSENVPADTVLAQQPPPGGRIVRGGTVTVFLSRGPERYAVPDITGQEYDFAVTRIPSQFLVERVEGFSDSLPVNYVAGTDPAVGTLLAPGDTVRVIVVTGPYPIHVPSVVGQRLGDAQNRLRSAGFTNIVVEHRDDDRPKDEVLEQSPEGGKGLASIDGTQVTLWVSNGPKQPMPELVGRNCQEAVQILQAIEGLNLNVSTPGVADPLRPLTSVKAQAIPAGEPLTEGQTVELSCGL